MAPAHLVVGLVFNLYPAEQKPVVGHVALAVQQFVSLAVASLPAVAPALQTHTQAGMTSEKKDLRFPRNMKVQNVRTFLKGEIG